MVASLVLGLSACGGPLEGDVGALPADTAVALELTVTQRGTDIHLLALCDSGNSKACTLKTELEQTMRASAVLVATYDLDQLCVDGSNNACVLVSSLATRSFCGVVDPNGHGKQSYRCNGDSMGH